MWQKILKTNFTDWKKLADFLQLTEAQQEEIAKRPRFILNLPMRLAEKIQKGTLEDPLLKQFLPTVSENIKNPLFVSDPVGDSASLCEPKLLHKYNGRVLLITTSACAMHCRYCFRQNFDYAVNEKAFDKELQAIADDNTISEVILSGGDPLSLSDKTLDALFRKIKAIPHIQRIRIHTRFPIGIPERIDEDFLAILNNASLAIWFVIHCNHARELDDEILARLKLLQKQGITILNQSVLLRGVNDSVHTLKDLCEKLINNNILPYYLHQLDRVQGAGHFEVSEEEGKNLISELTMLLPGYAVPKYVRETKGEPAKTQII